MFFLNTFLGTCETVESPLGEKTKFLDQWLRLKMKPKICTFCILIFVIVVVIVIVVACCTGSRFGYSPTNSYSMYKQQCIGDKFEQICFNVTESGGGKTNKCIKFLFVEDVINDEYYNFQDAKNACIKLESSLWEIADGQPEWDAVIQIAKKLNKSSMWLNAETTNSTCQGMILL